MDNGIYFPNVAVDLKKMQSDELAVTLNEYTSALRADEPDRRRCVRNMLVSLGLDDDQWEPSLASEMKRDGRIPKTYNFAQLYIRGLAGNFMMNWFDPRFVDRTDDAVDVSWATDAMQAAWYSQKDLYNYKKSAGSCIWNGLTYRGVEEICIDRIKDRRGGIRFDSIRPDRILFEQTPEADGICAAARKAWKRFLLTPAQMIQFYPHMEKSVLEGVQRLAESVKKTGEQHEYQRVEAFNRTKFNYAFGDKYECVEYYHLEWEKVEKVIHKSGVELPEFGFEVGSKDDYYAKVLWGASQGIDVNSETIQTIQVWEAVLYVTTFCESLNIVFENRKDERQIKRLPFFDWSFITKYGKSIGAIDLLIDPQQDINKREAAKTKILSQTPIAGKYWVHPEAYGNDIQKREAFNSEFNDPSSILHLDEDAPPGVSLFGVMSGNQIPPSILQDETSKMDFMNRIVSLPLAMQGITERAGESGLHLGRKVIEGSVMQRIPLESYIQHEHDKAEAWVMLGLKLWQGPLQQNRIFKGVKPMKEIVINKFVGYNEDGASILENDLSTIERLDVIISQAKENDYMRQAKRELDAAVLNSIRPTATNGPAIASFVTDLINSADYADDEHREKSVSAANLYYELEMTNGQAQLLASKANLLKAEEQYKQLVAQTKAVETQRRQQVTQVQQGQPQQPQGGQRAPQGQQGISMPPEVAAEAAELYGVGEPAPARTERAPMERASFEDRQIEPIGG